MSDAGQLLVDARSRAGLSQRALAQRARTTQSVIARIESDVVSPSFRTLQRLLHAAGFDLQASLAPRLAGSSHMLDDVARILRLSPEDRLRELHNASRLFATATAVPQLAAHEPAGISAPDGRRGRDTRP